MNRARIQFSTRAILILTAVIACTYPWWNEALEKFTVARRLGFNTRPEWRFVSPFTNVSIDEDVALVEFDGVTYKLESIEGVSTPQLLRFAELGFGSELAEKRFREDLAEVLQAAGLDGKADCVDLVLRDLVTLKLIEVKDAPMTRTNRQKIPK